MRGKTVFLSFTHEDREVAERLVRSLERDGLTVAWDRALHLGDNIPIRIDERLLRAQVVLVLWSEAACGSRFVRSEWRQAFEGQRLIPVRIDAQPLPDDMGDVRAVSLIGWAGDRFDPRYAALVAAIRAGRGVKAPALPEGERGTSTLVWLAGVALAVALAWCTVTRWISL